MRLRGFVIRLSLFYLGAGAVVTPFCSPTKVGHPGPNIAP